MIRFMRAAGVCVALFLPALPVASEVAHPSGPVVLNVTGVINAGSTSGTAEFDLDMLEALPQLATETHTPWFEGTTTFTGPRLSTILDAVEGQGGTLRVYALNDYSAEIPITEIRDYPVILATRVNGKRLSVRDKGPLIVIYPFSEYPELYNEVSFNKSVWQVSRIQIE